MDKAKAAVSDFMSKSGHHDTTVHETVAPAVQHEEVKAHNHENVTTAVDKEVHQDHHHRTVQPVKDREVLPEQHHHKLAATQHREFDNRDHQAVKQNLATEQAGFKDQQVVHDATHSQTAAPTVGGEHVHHHIHETIQPVVHKETVQPHVTHTTVPIHETHHNQAKIHEATQLPVMSMDDFKNKGGALHGREERYDGFEGEPKHIGGSLKDMMHNKESKRGHDDKLHEKNQHGDFDPMDGARSHDATSGAIRGSGHKQVDSGHHDTMGTAGVGQREALGSHNTHNNTHGSDHDLEKSTSQQSKPGLMQKLNPFTDADGDGKKGLMK